MLRVDTPVNGDFDMKIISMTASLRLSLRQLLLSVRWEQRRLAPSFPRGMTVSNMPKAERIVASRAMRSVRRPLPAKPLNAMRLQFAMMSIGDGNDEASTDSGCRILTPASNSK